VLYANRRGELRVHPTLQAVAQSGWELGAPDRLIPLPPGTTLMHLPGRVPLGSESGATVPVEDPDAVAVAAVLPPGYLRTLLPAYLDDDDAPVLPLFGYAAVADVDGEPHVAGLGTDRWSAASARHAYGRSVARRGVQGNTPTATGSLPSASSPALAAAARCRRS